MRSKPEPAEEPSILEIPTPGQINHQRNTVTGSLRTDVYFVQERFAIPDGDGDLWIIEDGASILVVNPAWADQAMVERMLDQAELFLHHTYGNRPAGERTRTLADIRTKGRKVEPADDIPF